jgi:hypothetical protein
VRGGRSVLSPWRMGGDQIRARDSDRCGTCRRLRGRQIRGECRPLNVVTVWLRDRHHRCVNSGRPMPAPRLPSPRCIAGPGWCVSTDVGLHYAGDSVCMTCRRPRGRQIRCECRSLGVVTVLLRHRHHPCVGLRGLWSSELSVFVTPIVHVDRGLVNLPASHRNRCSERRRQPAQSLGQPRPSGEPVAGSGQWLAAGPTHLRPRARRRPICRRGEQLAA